LLVALRENGQIKDSRLPFQIYVQKIQRRKLIKPVLNHKNSRGEIDGVIVADDAELTLLQEKKQLLIRLHNGRMSGPDGSRAQFEQREMLIDLPSDFGPK
jgi:hypothetical protein